MTNNERLKHIFTTSLGVDPSLIVDNLEYNSIPQWDSTAHMALVALLEGEFEIMLDIDDIIDMSSVAQSKLILAKYDINFG